MKTNIINWFRLKNWLELSFQYRLVDVAVEGTETNQKELNKAFFSAINFLSSETKGCVSLAYHEGKRYIAVKADSDFKRRVIPGSPMDIILTPVAGLHTFNPVTASENNIELGLRFIESSIDFQLNRNTNLWDGGPNTFLSKFPLKASEDIQTDIYNGFKFKVVAEDRNNVFVCIDLAYKYVDKKNLHELLKGYSPESYELLINGRNYLYQNGDDWYTVKGRSVGNGITKHQIELESFKGTVYDYISSKGKYAGAHDKQRLLQDSETFFHSYSNNSAKTVAGAACLAKAIHFADNGLHRLSINEPNKRFMRAEYHASKYFKGIIFNGQELKIDNKPHLKECDVFTMPSFKYGKNAILNPYTSHARYGSPLQNFPKLRREYVYNNGIINEGVFTPQYLFVPADMPYSFAKSVKYYFDKAIKQIANEFPGFIIEQYSLKSAPFASNVVKDLKKQIMDKNLSGGNALFILPENSDHGQFNKFLHSLVKKELFSEMKIKCVSAKSLKRYMKPIFNRFKQQIYEVPDGLMRDFRSYQINTIFEYLIINKKWPYALAEDLHHDLYIGVDAHDFFAGFVFFFKNGEKIVFDVEKVSKSVGSFRNEKINFKVIQDKIVAVLGRHLKSGEDTPKSIVILRDGVSFGEEEKALAGALQELSKMGLITIENVKTGVVDVAKSSSIPVRAAAYNGLNKPLENPECGTYFYTNDKHAFIFNTGAPYRVPGSSNPIQVSLTCGDIDFDKALEDVFRLTQLTFSSPDRPTSLPLPLKLIDTLIRDVAHQFDYANTQERELKIIEPSLN
ncbi:hypothetical protein [Mucilaginibacter flavidus]|uniref:hypothetical protein n=1 Tax=Mucilaginibacter flavidus TaxID=2949309 RepID=UPI002092C063|nr:hypothetical protein [Mucilaginibacter flavidus]MCO5950528.1 hypothetical protein [Mucilaginibacter flavidus]